MSNQTPSRIQEPATRVDTPEYGKLLRIIAEGCKEHSPPSFVKISDDEYAYNHIIELDHNSPTFGRPLKNSKVGDLLDNLKAKGCINVFSTEDNGLPISKNSKILEKPVYGGFLGEATPDRILVLKGSQKGQR
jgi:hypothetical protein